MNDLDPTLMTGGDPVGAPAAVLTPEDIRRLQRALMQGDGRLAQRGDVVELYKRLAKEAAERAARAEAGAKRAEAAFDRIEAALHVGAPYAKAPEPTPAAPRARPVRRLAGAAALVLLGLGLGAQYPQEINGFARDALSAAAAISSPGGDGFAAANGAN